MSKDKKMICWMNIYAHIFIYTIWIRLLTIKSKKINKKTNKMI